MGEWRESLRCLRLYRRLRREPSRTRGFSWISPVRDRAPEFVLYGQARTNRNPSSLLK